MTTLLLSAASPDAGATDESFYMLVCMFLLGCAVLAAVIRWYGQWRSPTKSMSRQEAEEELGHLLSERLGVALQSARLDAIIVARWTEWPIEYRPALYQMLRHAQILEDTMYNEAVESGVYPRRIVTNGPMLPPPPDRSPLSDTYVARIDAARPAGAAPESNVTTLGHRWVGDQLLRTGS